MCCVTAVWGLDFVFTVSISASLPEAHLILAANQIRSEENKIMLKNANIKVVIFDDVSSIA